MSKGAINFAKIAADLDTNPKVRRAGRNGREVYCFVLRRVALHKAQGRIPVSNVDTWYLADQLQMTEAEAEQGLAACLAPFRDRPGLLAIEGGDVIVCGWDDDWGRYPMDAAERKAAQRAREKPAAEPPVDVTTSHDESRGVTTGHGCHGSDKIRSRSDEIRPEGESAPARARSGGPVGVAAPMPDGWTPDESATNAAAAGVATARGVDVTEQLAILRERAASKGETSCDWNARWREWLLKAPPKLAPVRALASAPRAADEQRARAARDRERERDRAESARLENMRQLADRDRESNQRAARDALTTNFQNAENATG